MMIKFLHACILLSGFFFLQFESQMTNASLLITAIVTLAGVVTFLYLQNRALNRELHKQAEDHAKQMTLISEKHLEDYKDIIERNTKAFIEHSQSNREINTTLKEVQKKL